MIARPHPPSLSEARLRLEEIASREGCLDTPLLVRAGQLSPQEAIGTPLRRDFPIVLGKEKILEARFENAHGHAFTDSPVEFRGTLAEVLSRPLVTNADRALLVATLNALLRHLGRIDRTVHCRDEEPERCGARLAAEMRTHAGEATVGLIGCNPAMVAALAAEFGPEHVRVSDRNPDNVGRRKHGVAVWDGAGATEALIRDTSFVAVTGTTVVNDTFPAIRDLLRRYRRKYVVYGVTGAGLCHLFGWPRFCPFSHDA